MKENDSPREVGPVIEHKGINQINGTLALASLMFAATFAACFAAIIKDEPNVAAVFGILAALMLCLTVFFSFRTVDMVSLSADGVSYFSGRRRVLHIPAGEIRLVLTGLCTVGKNPKDYVVISALDMAQIARLREKQLKKDWVAREELPFRKQAPGWQEAFAAEYVKRMAGAYGIFGVGKNGILLIQYIPMIQAALPVLIPGVEIKECKYGTSIYENRFEDTADKDSRNIIRGGLEQSTYMIVAALMMVWLLFLAILLSVLELTPVVWVIAGVVLLGLLCLYLFAGGECDVLHLSPQGVKVTRRKKEVAFIPADSVRTVVQMGSRYSMGIAGKAVLISDKTEEELAQLEAQRLRKTAFGTRQLEGIMQLPGWQRILALSGAERRSSSAFTVWCKEQFILYTPQRAETIKQLYPHAVWIESFREPQTYKEK